MREEILIIIIIQKNILNRNRLKDGFNNQSSFKNFNEFKKRKFHEDSNSTFKPLKKDDDVTTRVFDNDSHEMFIRITIAIIMCVVIMKKKDHWKSNCFDRDKSQIYIVAITFSSKNDQISSTFLKRNKFNFESNSINSF